MADRPARIDPGGCQCCCDQLELLFESLVDTKKFVRMVYHSDRAGLVLVG